MPRCSCRPRKCGEDQDVDERILEEVYAVSEEGDRSDGECDGELDEEVGEIQRGNDEDDAAEGLHGLIVSALSPRPCVRAIVGVDGLARVLRRLLLA